VKTSAKTLRDIAVRRTCSLIREGANLEMPVELLADKVVGLVFELLAKPDREMLVAGRGELTLALPQGIRKGEQEQLAGMIWGAMLHRATL
jgi:hypothetical protein